MKVDITRNVQQFSPSEFLSAIIHELKTPLSAIMGFSEVLRDDMKDPSHVKECAIYAKEINEIAHDLNDLVHDLLDVGQVFSGNFSVNLSKRIDLRDIIKRSVRINYDYALKRNISIDVDVCEDLSLINLDEKRMKQIMVNLLSNAIKYSPANNKVQIDVKNNYKIFAPMSAVEISIRDFGYGMSQEQIEKAFLKYSTIENPNSQNVDSFGFGLPIVKKLVELQNGVIEVDSEIGRGTNIKLIFPYQN